MAWNTRWLVSAHVKAKKAGDTTEMARLQALIDGVEARCEHRAEKHRLREKDVENAKGKYEAGGVFHWCILCGKKLGYDPP